MSDEEFKHSPIDDDELAGFDSESGYPVRRFRLWELWERYLKRKVTDDVGDLQEQIDGKLGKTDTVGFASLIEQGNSESLNNNAQMAWRKADGTLVKRTWTDIKNGVRNDFGALINTASVKTTPEDGDKVIVGSSSESWASRGVTLLNLWTNLFKAKADALYLSLTGGSLSGNISVNNVGSASEVTINTDNTDRYGFLNFTRNGVLRWRVLKGNDAEGGSNSGSNFYVMRYDDSGNWLANALSINRPDGWTTIGSNLTVSSSTPQLLLNTGNASENALLRFNRNGSNRWAIFKGNGAEVGSNAGSDLSIYAYSDAGNFLSQPFYIVRSTGQTVVNTLNMGGGQIQFPATQNPSSGANVLDDYEEGTWTPTVEFGGGTTGIAYSAQAGTYIKIGRLLYIDGNFTLTSKGSSTGEATMTIPFTLSSEPGGIPNYAVNLSSVSGGTMMWGQGSSLKWRMMGTTGITNTSLTNSHFNNNTACYFSIVGRVSA